jgi:hypothetical protein
MKCEMHKFGSNIGAAAGLITSEFYCKKPAGRRVLLSPLEIIPLKNFLCNPNILLKIYLTCKVCK